MLHTGATLWTVTLHTARETMSWPPWKVRRTRGKMLWATLCLPISIASTRSQAELAEAPLLFESGGEGGDAIGDGAPHVSVGSACQNGGDAPPDALGQAIVPWQPS